MSLGKLLPCFIAILFLSACETTPKVDPETPKPSTDKPSVVIKQGGGYYKDDGPADQIPQNLENIPDAEPIWEPLHKPATRPYVVLGKKYIPHTELKPYKAQGMASWYGKKFHGKKTSIGEPYDMFAMTAAHPTLPLPSYARVTHLKTGKSVIVRITDRGPFHAGRIIDLSYTAAHKLGIINGGSGKVEVEAIIPDKTTMLAQAPAKKPLPSAPPPTTVEQDEIELLANRLAQEESSVQTLAAIDDAIPKGVYLQLGAFANIDNAQNLKSRLIYELDWPSESMRIRPEGGIHRLHIGPYANRDEADRIGEKIRSKFGFKPTIIIH